MDTFSFDRRSVAERAMARHLAGSIAALLAAALLAGCASANVTKLEAYKGETLAKPDRVVVYGFAYAPGQGGAAGQGTGQGTAGDAAGQPALTPEQVEFGKSISDVLQAVLVEEIGAFGIPTEPAGKLAGAEGTALLIQGQFISVDEGSAAARMLVGFGAGRTKVVTRSQVRYATPEGEEQIKQFEVVGTSGSKPGFIMPLGIGGATGQMKRSVIIGGTATVVSEAVGPDVLSDTQRTGKELAAELGRFFKRQGWI
ncbi:MAG: DUF4410 domain-containing protein [Kiloniellales bacterium]|nr:DUF4410 domain-containing protein [Kiloniellales bacterium]